MRELYLPKYCILEAPIRENIEIPDAAKIYFGELAVLATKYNYIPYSDEELASMKGVDERTIKRWHTDLENHGFIRRETRNELIPGEQCKWLRKRKIYINQNPNSKNVSDSDKNVPSDDGDKNVPSYKQDYKQDNKQQQKPSAVAVFSCLKKLGIPQKEKEWITKHFDEKEVKAAIAYTDEMEKQRKIETSYVQVLKWACREKPEKPLSNKEEDIIERNKSKIYSIFNNKLEGKLITNNNVPITYNIYNKYIEFIFGMRVEIFDFMEKNCIDMLMKLIEKTFPVERNGLKI